MATSSGSLAKVFGYISPLRGWPTLPFGVSLIKTRKGKHVGQDYDRGYDGDDDSGTMPPPTPALASASLAVRMNINSTGGGGAGRVAQAAATLRVSSSRPQVPNTRRTD